RAAAFLLTEAPPTARHCVVALPRSGRSSLRVRLTAPDGSWLSDPVTFVDGPPLNPRWTPEGLRLAWDGGTWAHVRIDRMRWNGGVVLDAPLRQARAADGSTPLDAAWLADAPADLVLTPLDAEGCCGVSESLPVPEAIRRVVAS